MSGSSEMLEGRLLRCRGTVALVVRTKKGRKSFGVEDLAKKALRAGESIRLPGITCRLTGRIDLCYSNGL